MTFIKVIPPETEEVKKDLESLGIDNFKEVCTKLEVEGVSPENMELFLDRVAEDFKGKYHITIICNNKKSFFWWADS